MSHQDGISSRNLAQSGNRKTPCLLIGVIRRPGERSPGIVGVLPFQERDLPQMSMRVTAPKPLHYALNRHFAFHLSLHGSTVGLVEATVYRLYRPGDARPLSGEWVLKRERNRSQVDPPANLPCPRMPMSVTGCVHQWPAAVMGYRRARKQERSGQESRRTPRPSIVSQAVHDVNLSRSIGLSALAGGDRRLLRFLGRDCSSITKARPAPLGCDSGTVRRSDGASYGAHAHRNRSPVALCVIAIGGSASPLVQPGAWHRWWRGSFIR